jgi:ATP-binding cassette subfamily F protein 3
LSVLAGGEKSRVARAKLVREGANLLVLDEPTNHLDIESREVIEAALCAYTGSVLVVSHDRYFLDRVVDHILELRFEGSPLRLGKYSAYAASRARVAAPPVREAPPPKTGISRTPTPEKRERTKDYDLQKRRRRGEDRLRRKVREAESAVGALESRREALLSAMADPALGSDAIELGKLHAELETVSGEIQAVLRAWEQYTIELEGFLDRDNP